MKEKTKSESKHNDVDAHYVLNELKVPLNVVVEGFNLLRDLCNEPDPRTEQLYTTVQANLEKLTTMLDGIIATIEGRSGKKSSLPIHFDIMQQVQQVSATHDILFLQRQLRYHITASADLPKVYANPEQILVVLSNLISNAIKYTPRGSQIEIKVREVSLRQGAGVEVSIVNESEGFSERDRYRIFEKFYSTKPQEQAKGEGVGLAISREIVQHSHGQLWVDIPEKGKVAFTFVIPCAEIKEAKTGNHQTFKYDITISNYPQIQEKFGNDKSFQLLSQVEDYVRRLVRYPIDVVTAFEQSGTISTIYETQEGNASSVAARISHKLGAEAFKIGKNSINVNFQYHLSVLQ